MSGEKKTIPDQFGNKITGVVVDVDVKASSEKFSEIILVDGTKIKLKPVVTEVVRADEGHDPDGNPIYIVQTTTVLTVSNVDDQLKKKGV